MDDTRDILVTKFYQPFANLEKVEEWSSDVRFQSSPLQMLGFKLSFFKAVHFITDVRFGC